MWFLMTAQIVSHDINNMLDKLYVTHFQNFMRVRHKSLLPPSVRGTAALSASNLPLSRPSSLRSRDRSTRTSPSG